MDYVSEQAERLKTITMFINIPDVTFNSFQIWFISNVEMMRKPLDSHMKAIITSHLFMDCTFTDDAKTMYKI